MVGSSEWTAIQQVVDRLKQSYPSVPPDTVTTVVTRIMPGLMDDLCATSCRCLLSAAPAMSWRSSVVNRARRFD